MSSIVDVIEQKYKVLTDAQAALNTAKTAFEAAKANEFEMQRQYDHHNGNGDGPNANAVWPLLLSARAETIRCAGVVNSRQADTDAALKAYNDYKASLSPQEKETLNSVIVNQSAAQLAASNAALATANYATKKYTYLIVGIVIIIVVSLVYYFKYKRNKG